METEKQKFAFFVSAEDMMEMFSQAVDAGISAYLRSIEPKLDYIHFGKARDYVMSRGFTARDLTRWQRLGLVRTYKESTHKNSRRIFSTAELKAVMLSIQLKRRQLDALEAEAGL